MGKHFSPIVTIYSNHRVVDKGPYKLVRHPAYGGAIITILGVSIALRSIFSLISVLIIAQIYNYRENLEERLLIKNLGEEYEEYKRRVRKKFIPYLLLSTTRAQIPANNYIFISRLKVNKAL